MLRTIYLESDPGYRKWAGYLTDEGRWTEVAREWALFRELDLGSVLRVMHLVIAPVYQGLTAISFEVFGVSFASARIVSALLGTALVVSTIAFTRDRLHRSAVVFVAFAMAVQPELVFLSRIAIPEIGAMLFEFAAFALIISTHRTTGRAFAGGLCTALALGMKATVFPFVPIAVVILLVNDRSDSGRDRFRRASAFAAGVGGPAVVVLGAGLTMAGGGGGGNVVGSALVGAADFVRLSDPYSVVANLFFTSYAPVLNVLLAPAWALGGVLLAAGRKPSGADWSLYRGTAIWIAAWIVVASSLAYFPGRYVVHVVIPLVLHLGAGISLVRRLWGEGATPATVVGAGWRRTLVTAWWTVPAAIALAPILLGLVPDSFGFASDSFRVMVAAIGLCEVALLGALVTSRPVDPRIWVVLLVGPVAYVPLVLAAIEIGFVEGFWAVGGDDTFRKGVLLSGSFAITGLISRTVPIMSPLRLGLGAYWVPLGLLWIAQIAPPLLTRTYTIRDASVLIEALAEDSSSVDVISAGGLFLGNELKYRDVSPTVFESESPPEFAVVFHTPPQPFALTNYDTLAVVRPRTGDLLVPLDSRVTIHRRRARPRP